ncbi:MAG: leucine--tRNA ligase [Bacteroidetes bacterium]|nr:MAG: leucine--tRNA ligase [Bacteroidota bacterium]
MGTYDFRRIEKAWQQYWKDHGTFTAEKESTKPKYYVLDMFPYPSGAGLHVGHPLGYIATDIVARYKRLKGFNVLHPMGFDAFGLPAEQYAIQTGIHPAETTRKNIDRYLEQMTILGLHHDPETQISTSDPDYYKWTQWIFVQLFEHWYDKHADKARPIADLEAHFAQYGTAGLKAATTYKGTFTAAAWQAMSRKAQADILMEYRLAYAGEATVNWCPALGTVLANEEIKDGKSERGGHPVERRKMRQWMLRITAYADRLLYALDRLDWSDAMKTMQTNWIGRSEGASIRFGVEGQTDELEVFTTRPDTLYGVTFMVVAPEHSIVDKITTAEQKEAVQAYVAAAQNRSEIERMAGTTKTGVFTGGYALHPITGARIPIWVSDYVVITYGTGAIMAVPSGDQRDWDFAKKFGIPIVKITEEGDIEEAAYDSKDARLINSDFLNGMTGHEAIKAMIAKLEELGKGEREITYRQRDVIWSRQRYWGEPTPITYDAEGVAQAVPLDQLPLTLPEVDEYKPSPDGEPPLGRAQDWKNLPDGSVRDLNTMPGLAGSSWYFLRYTDAYNDSHYADPKRLQYWMPVDLYVGGTEHAVGHLLYARFWTHFLHDIGECPVDEPFSRLVNQGMIQGTSQLAYRHQASNAFVSADLVTKETESQYSQLHVPVGFVRNGILDTEAYKAWVQDDSLVFETNEAGEFHTTSMVEKMSKSKYNTVDPAEICETYGADTLRLYEMFLGPIEVAKPWNTDGITGVAGFLKRFYNLFFGDQEEWLVSDDAPEEAELRELHKAIKQVEEGIERLAFNTCVPAYMVLAKELSRMGCRKRAILEPFVVLISPFAPHLAEELWARLGHDSSVLEAAFPQWEERYVVENQIEYPVQVNGKVRAKVSVAADASKEEVEKVALAHERVQEFLAGRSPRKVIVVPGRIVNVVV